MTNCPLTETFVLTPNVFPSWVLIYQIRLWPPVAMVMALSIIIALDLQTACQAGGTDCRTVSTLPTCYGLPHSLHTTNMLWTAAQSPHYQHAMDCRTVSTLPTCYGLLHSLHTTNMLWTAAQSPHYQHAMVNLSSRADSTIVWLPWRRSHAHTQPFQMN